MDKIWIKYEKRVHGHPEVIYFLFEREKYDNKETLEYYFEYVWPDLLVGGENVGYEHECEVVDHPPIEWLQKEYVRTSTEIVETQEYAEFLSQEILKTK